MFFGRLPTYMHILGSIYNLDCLRELFDHILFREFSCWDEFEKWSQDLLQQQLLQPLKRLLNASKDIEYPFISQLHDSNHDSNNPKCKESNNNSNSGDKSDRNRNSNEPHSPIPRVSSPLYLHLLNYLTCTHNDFSRLTRDVSVHVTPHSTHPSLLFLKSRDDDVAWNSCTNVTCNGIIIHKVCGVVWRCHQCVCLSLIFFNFFPCYLFFLSSLFLVSFFLLFLLALWLMTPVSFSFFVRVHTDLTWNCLLPLRPFPTTHQQAHTFLHRIHCCQK